MKLDRTTYEAWLLDRIEGNLSPAQERELEAFLAANPDLDVPFGELPTIGEEGLVFDLKAGLKKSLPPAGEPDAARLDDFLVARLEGDLDKSQELALDRFLYEHPQHAQDAKRVAATKLNEGPFPFADKPTIERHFPPQGKPDKHRLTDFLIAALEGDLTAEQAAALARYVDSHPEAQREMRSIGSARVIAEPVVFVGKEGLKKREGRVIMLWQRYAVAASIALLLGFAWWVMRDGRGEVPVIAKKETVKQEVASDKKDVVGAPEPTNQTAQDQFGTLLQAPNGASTRADSGEGTPARNTQPARITPLAEEEFPAPEPDLVEAPPVQQPEPAPFLAHQPEPVPDTEGQTNSDITHGGEQPAMMVVAAPTESGSPLATVLANSVRVGVLETDERSTGLDGGDALALVNKGLGAITGGEGRVQVDRKGSRDRWGVRLGRNLTISASTGR